MPYAVMLFDGPDAPRLRREHLAAHLAYAESRQDKLLVAGPFRRPDGYAGSLLILAVETEDEARAILVDDPYWRAGVWAEVRFKPFRPVIGTWIGGKSW